MLAARTAMAAKKDVAARQKVANAIIALQRIHDASPAAGAVLTDVPTADATHLQFAEGDIEYHYACDCGVTVALNEAQKLWRHFLSKHHLQFVSTARRQAGNIAARCALVVVNFDSSSCMCKRRLGPVRVSPGVLNCLQVVLDVFVLRPQYHLLTRS
jgi:hypothetical protein